MASQKYVHIGDLITLYEDASDGYLGSGGISETQIGVRAVSDAHHAQRVATESVFRLRQQQNYSVTKQMRAFREREGLSAQDAVMDERYKEFLPEREREKVNNLQEFENTRGRVLRYGMIVQLQHVDSHKYACVARQSAVLNPDGRRVCLDRDAGETAWLRVMPRLRVHSEGEMVHVGDPVTLEHVHTGLLLNVDLRPQSILPDGRREVPAFRGPSPEARGPSEPPPPPPASASAWSALKARAKELGRPLT